MSNLWSRLDGQRIRHVGNGELTVGPVPGFEGVPDGIADKFLNGSFHGPSAKRLVNASSDKKFNGFLRNSAIKTLLPEAFQFLENGEPSDFPLCIRGKRFENDFLVKASDGFRAEKSMKFGDNHPFQSRNRELAFLLRIGYFPESRQRRGILPSVGWRQTFKPTNKVNAPH